jgi:DNA polymerase-3 subunit alpha
VTSAALSPTAATPMRSRWRAMAGAVRYRYYLELQRLGRADDESLIAKIVALSQKTGIPVVAPTSALPRAQRFRSHEARVCISDGASSPIPARPQYTAAQYLRTPAEMASSFADIPEALAEFRRDRAALFAAAQARRIAAA